MQGYKKRSVAPLNGALQEGVVKDGRYEIFIQSSGIAGKDWAEVLKKKGFPVEPSARGVLCSPGFKISSGERNIIVIFNFSAFQEAIKEPDFKKNYAPPTAEMACYLRYKLKGPELKALMIERLAVTHEPIVIDGISRVLVIRHNDLIKGFTSLSVRGGNKLHGVDGYAYVKKR